MSKLGNLGALTGLEIEEEEEEDEVFDQTYLGAKYFFFLSFPQNERNGILLLKLFWPTVRKNCSSDQEKLLELEAEGQQFATFLKSLEQFIPTAKGQNNFWNRILF